MTACSRSGGPGTAVVGARRRGDGCGEPRVRGVRRRHLGRGQLARGQRPHGHARAGLRGVDLGDGTERGRDPAIRARRRGGGRRRTHRPVVSLWETIVSLAEAVNQPSLTRWPVLAMAMFGPVMFWLLSNRERFDRRHTGLIAAAPSSPCSRLSTGLASELRRHLPAFAVLLYAAVAAERGWRPVSAASGRMSRPLRLAFFNRSYYPDFGATGQLLTELCEDLVARHGHQVTVVAGVPLSSAVTSVVSALVPARARGMAQRRAHTPRLRHDARQAPLHRSRHQLHELFRQRAGRRHATGPG